MKYIIGNNLDIKNIIYEHFSSCKHFVLCDKNIYRIYKALIDDIADDILVINPGEKYKTKESLFNILDALISKEYSRSDCLISVGGGLIGDIAGLAANLYMRGMPHIIVATSIIAMSDSCIGGKTAINYGMLKNAFGTFYEPHISIADTMFLNTLPKEEYISGMGELFKITLLTGKLDILEDNIGNLIEHAANYKMDLVRKDLHDKSIRHLLNLGHTMGHAIELEYGISHGESVAMGIDFISNFSDNLGISVNLNQKVRKLMKNIRLRNINSIKIKDSVISRITSDKKRNKDNIDLVLLEDIGKPIIKSISIKKLVEFIRSNYVR